jgi:hypothetical protein
VWEGWESEGGREVWEGGVGGRCGREGWEGGVGGMGGRGWEDTKEGREGWVFLR